MLLYIHDDLCISRNHIHSVVEMQYTIDLSSLQF